MNIKRFIKYVFSASVMLFAVACSADLVEPDNVGAGLTADGKVVVSMDIDPADFTKPVLTRATAANPNETRIENVVIWVFAGATRDDAVLVEVALGKVEAGGNSIKAALSPRSGPVWIALATDVMWQDYLEYLIYVEGGEEEFCSFLQEHTKSQSLVQFCDEDSETTNNIESESNSVFGEYIVSGPYIDNPTYYSKPIPKSAILESTSGIYLGMNPTAGDNNKLKLQRITAKVSVVSQDDDFVPEDMYLYDTPIFGNFFRSSSTIPDYSAGEGETATSQAFIGSYMDPGTEMALYPYEAPASNTPYLFLKATYKGEPYIYVLDFTAIDGTPMDILRNHHYKFVIREGAVGMEPPQNFTDYYMAGQIDQLSELDSYVEVTDLSGHIVTSAITGDYYLGLSNEEFIVMAEEDVDLFHIHAATVTTDLSISDDPTPNHMHLSSKYVTITSDTGESGGESLFLPMYNGDDVSTNIYIDIPANVNYGKVTINLGDIKKEITVRRVQPFVYDGSGYLLGADVLHAEIDNECGVGDNDWLKGFSVNGRGAEPALIRSTAGPVYMMAKNWEGTMDAGVYYTHEGGGRTKLLASIVPNDANSYIVKPGGSVDILARKAYDIWADNLIMGANSTILAGEESVEVLWQDTPTPGLITPTLITSSEISETIIRVNTHVTAEGNAMLVYKVDGEIRWSWHIWVTADKDIIEAGAGTDNKWMDRNLGALINSYDIARQGDISGFHYQAGRKDPFPGVYRTTGGLRLTKPFYDSQGVSLASPTVINNMATLKEAIENPYIFYESGMPAPGSDCIKDLRNARYIWRDPHTSQAHPTAKSIFDPCPAGWRVPVHGEFGGTTEEWLPVTNGRYNAAYGGFYFCYGGGVNPSATNNYIFQVGVGASAYYRTSTPTGEGNQYSLYLSSSGSTSGFNLDHTTIKQIGTFIRCTKAD